MTVIFEYQTFVKDHTLSIALHLPYWFGMSKNTTAENVPADLEDDHRCYKPLP